MIKINDEFPSFNLEGVDGDNRIQSISSENYIDDWKVFYFYPKDFTFICPTEIEQMDRIQRELNIPVIGFSGDNEYCKLNWKQNNKLIENIIHPLVADTGLSLSNELGIVDEENGVCFRATFIINPNNRIQHISINALDTGRNVDEIIRTLQALQSGGLTGCNWKIGDELL
tara:strand:- start:184 stop:696 length:513 start_codon:yes stop_codon:yes gene_type:complete